MLDDDRKMQLQVWIAARLGQPDLVIESLQPLGGGAIQENWRVRCRFDQGRIAREFVLRKDAAATIASSRPRDQEFAILKAAYKAGVCVPEPIGFCADTAVIGASFALMGLVAGVGLGPRVVKDLSLGGDRARLAERLGRELAKVHAIKPPRSDLAFLGDPPVNPAFEEVEALRAALDRLDVVRPALEWGLRWAERYGAACPEPTLAHRDFRTGNYMVDENGLTAVLDWEFAGWGDPMSDIGWFCAECWRFGRANLEAGGIAPRADFYRGYEAERGVRIEAAAVRFWEAMAHMRWAVIALEQGHRHLSGVEDSLELALTGRIAPELELAILRAASPDQWSSAHA